MSEPKINPCKCGGKASVGLPCYVEESVLILCEQCDATSQSFTLGEQSEGISEAIRDWNEHNPTPVSVSIPELLAAAARLEDDMRRYLYDRTPERRIKCLDQYRERIGLGTWAESQGGN